MQSPIKLVALLRPSTRADVIAAVAFSGVVFTATPFLLEPVVERLDVSLASASSIASAQLGGFVLTSTVADRFLVANIRLLRIALMLAATSQIASAFAPTFELLIAARVLSGFSLGTLTVIAWRQVFGDAEKMGDLSVTGPVIGVLAAPVAAVLADAGGDRLVFGALAAIAVVPLWLSHGRPELDAGEDRSASRHRPRPAALGLLAALSIMTLGGSAIFVFAAALGTGRAGLDPLVVAVAFSANAALGIPAARYRGTRRLSGLWVLVTALAALGLATTNGPLFVAAIAVWGFAFWAAVPGVFSLLAERSAYPAERAGDAQAVMAVGRVVGPLAGGVVLDTWSAQTLAATASATIAVAALMMLAIEAFTAAIDHPTH